jgi:hypothetical protein
MAKHIHIHVGTKDGQREDVSNARSIQSSLKQGSAKCATLKNSTQDSEYKEIAQKVNQLIEEAISRLSGIA